jgi:hypothetical protein
MVTLSGYSILSSSNTAFPYRAGTLENKKHGKEQHKYIFYFGKITQLVKKILLKA